MQWQWWWHHSVDIIGSVLFRFEQNQSNQQMSTQLNFLTIWMSSGLGQGWSFNDLVVIRWNVLPFFSQSKCPTRCSRLSEPTPKTAERTCSNCLLAFEVQHLALCGPKASVEVGLDWVEPNNGRNCPTWIGLSDCAVPSSGCCQRTGSPPTLPWLTICNATR